MGGDAECRRCDPSLCILSHPQRLVKRKGPGGRGGAARMAASGPCAPCGLSGGPHGGPRPGPRRSPFPASPVPALPPARGVWGGDGIAAVPVPSEREVVQDGFGDFSNPALDHVGDLDGVQRDICLDHVANLRLGHVVENVFDCVADDVVHVLH